MGSEVEVMKEEVMFGNCILSSEVKNVAGPATPEENWEHNSNKQQQQDLSSPCPNANETFSSSSLDTPKETLFDSFAPPASNKFLLAPQHTKYRQEWRNHIVRRLDFTGDDLSSNVAVDVVKSWCSSSSSKEEEEEEEEQRLFEIVYFSIMDAILSDQQDAKDDAILSDQQDAKEEAPTTPKSAPLLDGIAHTCPAPPVKYSAAKHKSIIDKEICKKLDF